MQNFDAIIVGAGQAGPSLAGRLTKAGWSIAFVERKLFGGTCINTGCTPTKAMVASAHAAHLARRAADFGVRVPEVSIDIAAVIARREAIVGASRNGVEKSLRSNPKVTVFTGTASFESPKVLRVGEEQLTAKHIFLNVGGRAVVPDMPGVHDVPYLTNTSLLALNVLPKHLVIVGGSYIGIEFGQMYRRFGSEVTIIEKSSRLVPREDEDVSACVQSILEGEGITVRLDAECIELAPNAQGIQAGAKCSKGEPVIVGSHVLLAVEIVAANILDNDPRRVSDRVVCYAMYMDPPLARIGMTEAEVRAGGKPALIGTRAMTRVGRAVEKGETLGFMKVLVDAENKLLLGASLLGVGCDEAIHCLLDTMYARAPYTTVQRAVHIHPTVAELIPTMLGDLKPLV